MMTRTSNKVILPTSILSGVLLGYMNIGNNTLFKWTCTKSICAFLAKIQFCVKSSFAIILMGKRELVALHCLPGVS